MNVSHIVQNLRRFVFAVVMVGSAWLSASSAQAAPAAPANIRVDRGENLNGPRISWDLSTDASLSEYVIERSWNGARFAILARGPAAGVSGVTDPVVPFSGSVTYRVKAINNLGEESPYSTTAPLPLLTPAGRPIAVTATADVTSGPAPLTVTIATNGGADTLTRWTADGQLDSYGNPFSYTFSQAGLYVVSVEVTRLAADGVLEFAFVEMFITVEPPLPVPLTVAQDLVASSPRRGVVTLQWTNPPISSATTLQVNRSNGPARRQTQMTWSVALDQTSFTDSTAKPGISYTYVLTASNGPATAFSNAVTISAR